MQISFLITFQNVNSQTSCKFYLIMESELSLEIFPDLTLEDLLIFDRKLCAFASFSPGPHTADYRQNCYRVCLGRKKESYKCSRTCSSHEKLQNNEQILITL